MAAYRLRVGARVLPFLRGLDAADRGEVRRLLGLIQLDPVPDNRAKILIPVLPVFYTAYVTGRFWIVYHVSGDVIIIDNIGRSGLSEPSP